MKRSFGKCFRDLTLGLAGVLLIAVSVGKAEAQDLTVTWKKVRQACHMGILTCAIKGKFVVSNLDGANGTASSTVSIYLSDDAVLNTGGDDLLTQIPVGPLAAGETKSIKPNVQLPSVTSASGRFLIAVADSGNAVNESNENNNLAVFANPGPTGIVLFDKLFGPETVTVPVGARVRWMHKDGGDDHTVTSGTCNGNGCNPNGLFNSVTPNQEFMAQHDEFIHVFNAAGQFAYYCMKHEEDMTGTITVVAP
jgi:plastocyanin